jgi:hypothetical protein
LVCALSKEPAPDEPLDEVLVRPESVVPEPPVGSSPRFIKGVILGTPIDEFGLFE